MIREERQQAIARRLEAGDDPLHLTIAAWEEKLDAAQKGQDIGEMLGPANCALCHLYMTGCIRCPLYKRYREKCSWGDSPYKRVLSALNEGTQEELIEAVQAVLSRLKSLKEET